MALNHSPRIVTDGLAFAYDMTNTKKSFKGKPTTNYIPYPYASYNGTSIVLGYNYPNNNATYTYVTGVNNPVNAPGVFQYYTGNTDYKYFSIDSTAIPTTGTYTFSYYARIVGGPSSSTNLSNSQLWRDNVLGDQAVSGDWNPTFTTEWKRYSTTGPVQAGSILQYFPIHSGAVTGGYTIQYCGFQMEMSTFSTPFVVGTRSNTQALIDLIGNNTITANSLTYASDGTFSFNGANNYVGAGNFGTWPSQGTISFWMNSSAVENYRNPFHTHFEGVNTGIRFEQSNGGVFGVLCGNDVGTFASGTLSTTLTTNTWYCVTVTWNSASSNFTGYMNGVQSFSVSCTTFATQMPSVTFGYGFGSGRYFSGKISNASIYNRALSAAEVKQNFNALRGRYGI